MSKNKVLMVLVSLILPFVLGVQLAMADTSDSAQTCLRGLLYLNNGCSTVDYMSIDYTPVMNEKAESFLKEIKARQLNVVTAESLTSGMIISTIVNIPLYGSYTYGGFSTYDSDAKRKMLGVKKGDVYTETTARQMAAGALKNSRAMVSIAVTGNAGPVDKNKLDDLGVVNAAVSIRTISESQDSDIHEQPIVFNTRHRRMALCDGDGLPMTEVVCQQYRSEAEADPKGYVSAPTLSMTRKLIRQNVVIDALELAQQHLQNFVCTSDGDNVTCKTLDSMCQEPYDGRYIRYGEPTWVIKEHSELCRVGMAKGRGNRKQGRRNRN
ncbi:MULTISPECIES: CinA family protein [Moorena]|uniref:CinA C-terminal domain-containing protein n=1 Tax=Moorena producens 3L TaxID=489825 RepID=F4Y206_9CYAN|nr:MULTISPECIES: CinA family protein [Moorena]EGJ29298.1 hypothetical protein LYNGBM3L_65230 [Moorena producens 3L]NEP33811.1 CinA family protein [Moorena sp. SIO3B2]NEP67378.1 CinA family protein [Moorena sp. SIO3A5]OLT64225.1 hypothetical protein BI334_03560 [Moorena producens 3L]